MTYSITVIYSNGKKRHFKDVVSHAVILDNTMIDIVLQDGRRFLLPMRDREYEFSKELSHILEERRKNGGA